MSDQNNDSTPLPVTMPWYKRPKPRRNVIIIAAVLVVLTLLYSFAPTYIARFIIDSQLNKYGIEHTGVETLKINPWTMEIWLGPVKFRTGEIEHGQIGELGIKLNLFPAFQKHAMVERILVRGIDVYVARAEDSTLTLNGIPLKQFFPAKDKAEAEQSDKGSTPWGTGLAAFEMQDSRLIYKEKTGGTLTVQVDNLLLGQFISWTPDQAGTFQLKARINDIEFDWSGTARPFAEQITISANADTRQAELSKVIQYTGPLGKNPMERRDGIYNSVFQHEITLFKTGRLEGKTIGKMEVIGANYAQDESFALSVERADVDIDAAYSLSENNDLKIDGQIKMNVMKTDGKLSKENTFGLDKAHVELTDLSVAVNDDRSTSVSVKPQINLTNGDFTGRIHLSMDAMLNILRQLQSLSAGVEVTKEQTGLGYYTGDEVTLPKSTISIAQLNTASPKLVLTTTAGKVTLDHSFTAEATGLETATTERTTNIAKANTDISSLQLESGEGQLSLNLSGKIVLNGNQHKGPFAEARFETIELLNEKLDLQVKSGNIAVEVATKAAVKGSHVLVYKYEELPETSVSIGAVTTNMKKGRLALAQQKMQWQGSAEASIDEFGVNVDKGKVAATKFRHLKLRGASADQNLNINTDSLILSGLDVFVSRKYIDDIIATTKVQAAPKEQEKEIDTPSQAEKPSSAKPAKMELKIGRLAIDKDAKVRFEDKDVQPAIKVDTDFKTVELRDVDTKNPEKRAQVELIATINEFTNVELKGWADNLGPNANLDINGKIENLELPTYSPYIAEFGGVYLESGRFSTNTETKAQQGNLDGAINLDMQHLDFKPLSEDDAKRLSDKAGFPIQTAVGLLQDSKGRINLNFPVSGTIVKPDVDISSAISKAIGGTLKNIFPPTMIAGMLSSKETDSGVTFEPIKFKPGSDELDAEARKYVNELVTLLQERPILTLNVCGATNADDFVELTLIKINKPAKTPAAVEQRQRLIETHKPKLLELANERTHVVRRYMITEKGLDTKRVGECRPKFDVDDKGPPRVDVTL
jgi:hypothetical protein